MNVFLVEVAVSLDGVPGVQYLLTRSDYHSDAVGYAVDAIDPALTIVSLRVSGITEVQYDHRVMDIYERDDQFETDEEREVTMARARAVLARKDKFLFDAHECWKSLSGRSVQDATPYLSYISAQWRS